MPFDAVFAAWVALEGPLNENDFGSVAIFGINAKYNPAFCQENYLKLKEALRVSNKRGYVEVQNAAKAYLKAKYWPSEGPITLRVVEFMLLKAWSTPGTRKYRPADLLLKIQSDNLTSLSQEFSNNRISPRGVERRLRKTKELLGNFGINL